MGLTKEQQEEKKREHIDAVMRMINLDDLSGGDLKNKIKELHQRICKMEADKYDLGIFLFFLKLNKTGFFLEKRHERQVNCLILNF